MTYRTILAASAAASTLLIAGAAGAQDWSGFYFGVGVGGSVVGNEDGERTLFDTNLDGTFGDTVRTSMGADAFASSPTQAAGFCDGAALANNIGGGCTDDDQIEMEFSGRVGFDMQMGGFVLGVVGEASGTDVTDHTTGFSITPANYQFARQIDGPLYAIRGRAGLPFGRSLAYVTAGYAMADIEERYSTTNTANSFAPLTNSTDADGLQFGAGVEHWMTDRVVLGLEYLYTSLDVEDPLVVRIGNSGSTPPTNPFLIVNTAGTDNRRGSDEFNMHAVRLTASFRF